MKRAILLLGLGLSLTTATFPKNDILTKKEIIVNSKIQNSSANQISFDYNQKENKRLTEIAIKKSEKQPVILIDKLNRKLYLLENKKIIRNYPIDLGFNPLEDKLIEGDGCTPEGEFYIAEKKPFSKFYKAFLISYPSIEDAERGLKSKLIDQKQYNQITSAVKNKKIPNQNTKLGGLVEIHGCKLGYDWTLGCVAIKNEEMDSLDMYIEANGPVIIVKEIYK